MNHRGWGISKINGYYLLSMPGDYDFVQIPFWSEQCARDAIDERIDHPDRFDPMTLKRLIGSGPQGQ
jgi:hypothetical protein